MLETPRLRRVILHGRWGAPLRSPSSSAEKCERGAVTKCQLGLLSLTRRHERSPVGLFHPQKVALTMRIHGKVVVIAVCFGVFLLLYFLGGNAADEPLLKEVVEEQQEEDRKSSPSPPELGRDVAAKFAKKSSARVGVRAEEPHKRRKEGKAINRGAGVNAKRWGEFVSFSSVDLQPSWAPFFFLLHACFHLCALNSINNYSLLLNLICPCRQEVKEWACQRLIMLWSRRFSLHQTAHIVLKDAGWLHNSPICQGTLFNMHLGICLAAVCVHYFCSHLLDCESRCCNQGLLK